MIEYRYFNFIKDKDSIASFIEIANKSYCTNTKPVEWFEYKFMSAPDGNPIIAIAHEGSKIIGSFVFSNYSFAINNKIIKSAIQYATFVDPEHRGKGIALKLLQMCETEARNQGYSLFINFPNKISLPVFIKNNWTNASIIRYYLKFFSYRKIVYFMDIRKPFCPLKSTMNNNTYDSKEIENVLQLTDYNNNYMQSYYTYSFFYWRTNDLLSKHSTLLKKDCLIVYRVGLRGKLKEIQILGWFGKFKKLISVINEAAKIEFADIIGIPTSKNNPIKCSLLKNLFFKVPNSTNCTFKILDGSNLENEIKNKLLIKGLDFHMY